jgi:hypothetical protein
MDTDLNGLRTRRLNFSNCCQLFLNLTVPRIRRPKALVAQKHADGTMLAKHAPQYVCDLGSASDQCGTSSWNAVPLIAVNGRPLDGSRRQVNQKGTSPRVHCSVHQPVWWDWGLSV